MDFNFGGEYEKGVCFPSLGLEICGCRTTGLLDCWTAGVLDYLINEFESEIHLVRILYQMGMYVFQFWKYWITGLGYWIGLACLGLAWLGLACFALAWFGLPCFGLACFG